MSYKFHHEPENEFRNDINVVPLIDVILVLLVIFMIAMPAISMSVRSSSVQMQESADSSPEKEALVLVLYENGSLEYDGYPVSEDELSGRIPSDSRTRIIVRAEENVAFGRLNKILALLSAKPGIDLEISGF